MPENPDISFTDTLRVSICPDCFQPHALPRIQFIVAAAERRPISCHNGHAYVPGDPDKPDSNALLSNFALSAALADLRVQLVSLGRQLAAAAPEREADTKEIRRRANVLANRAEETRQGRVICPLCGIQKSTHRLSEHLRRSHRMQLADMPARSFD